MDADSSRKRRKKAAGPTYDASPHKVDYSQNTVCDLHLDDIAAARVSLQSLLERQRQCRAASFSGTACSNSDKLVPHVFRGMARSWPAAAWTPDTFCDDRFSCVTMRALFLEHASGIGATEAECLSLDVGLQDFAMWMTGRSDSILPLKPEMVGDAYSDQDQQDDIEQQQQQQQQHTEGNRHEGQGRVRLDRDRLWGYLSYNYMNKAFTREHHDAILSGMRWQDIGVDRVGEDTTFWMGTKGSHTNAHIDAYGCNVVAQLYGTKRWTFAAPNQPSGPRPVRVPYEESSIFAEQSMDGSDRHDRNLGPEEPRQAHGLQLPSSASSASSATPSSRVCVVELKPGDVLFVPRHWWHQVESLTDSISVNTWLPLPQDKRDRVGEAAVRWLIQGAMALHPELTHDWLCPSENMSSANDNLSLLCAAVEDASSVQNDQGRIGGKEALERLVNAFVHPTVIEAVCERLLGTDDRDNRHDIDDRADRDDSQHQSS